MEISSIASELAGVDLHEQGCQLRELFETEFAVFAPAVIPAGRLELCLVPFLM